MNAMPLKHSDAVKTSRLATPAHSKSRYISLSSTSYIIFGTHHIFWVVFLNGWDPHQNGVFILTSHFITESIFPIPCPDWFSFTAQLLSMTPNPFHLSHNQRSMNPPCASVAFFGHTTCPFNSISGIKGQTAGSKDEQ